ncbi:DUF6789 family protein [Stappia indica]|uniref:DUF6789 family protein n=1 Tax=Stappia indica TaxID=538381 RepID=UPI00082C1B75|nr:DUF6789 family protein [Stappia indica]
MSRVFYGAIAGCCATLAMTMAMRRLDERLARKERYPLPPREITETTLGQGRSRAALTVLSHFGFGAAAGALYGVLPRGLPGAIYGPAVWAASYLGWVPMLGILVPASRHPAGRNLLMVTVHVVWGSSLALGLKELEAASRTVFSEGQLEDTREDRGRG